jgi:cytochrome oxidase assembly protein ShyY1
MVLIIGCPDVPLRLRLGSRRWTARWPFIVLALLACAAFAGLGRWQWQRGDYRTAQWHDFEAGATPRAVTGAQLESLPRYTRVRVEGRLDGTRQILLDNITGEGRVGYDVLTPLVLADGSALLVNRGFVPGSGYRERLPDVALPASGADVLTLTGRLGTLPVAGLAAGRQPPPAEGPWPRVASFPTQADLAATLPWPLRPGVLLQDADSGPGFARAWEPPGLAPTRHYAYAVQWWAFAVLALVLLVFLNLEKQR